MLKTIGYAYASSPFADALSAPNGCYYVATQPNEETPASAPRGPFATIEKAEAWAARMPCPFSRYSRRAARAA